MGISERLVCLSLAEAFGLHTFLRTGSKTYAALRSDLFTAALCTQQGHINEVTDRSGASQGMNQNTWKKIHEMS